MADVNPTDDVAVLASLNNSPAVAGSIRPPEQPRDGRIVMSIVTTVRALRNDLYDLDGAIKEATNARDLESARLARLQLYRQQVRDVLTRVQVELTTARQYAASAKNPGPNGG